MTWRLGRNFLFGNARTLLDPCLSDNKKKNFTQYMSCCVELSAWADGEENTPSAYVPLDRDFFLTFGSACLPFVFFFFFFFLPGGGLPGALGTGVESGINSLSFLAYSSADSTREHSYQQTQSKLRRYRL